MSSRSRRRWYQLSLPREKWNWGTWLLFAVLLGGVAFFWQCLGMWEQWWELLAGWFGSTIEAMGLGRTSYRGRGRLAVAFFSLLVTCSVLLLPVVLVILPALAALYGLMHIAERREKQRADSPP